MSSFTPQRIMPHLKLALLGDCGCADTLDKLTSEARSLGMTGAEIDKALAGRSFEARTDAAVAFACAVKSGRHDAVDHARSRALRMGLSAAELEEVQAITKVILEGGSP